MNIVTNVKEWQAIRRELANQTVGLVPTMGNLHAGHLSLCEKSLAENAVTVVSIFVNPTQFNQAQDFDSYPRTLDQDAALLAALGVDYIIAPQATDMYPDQYQVRVTETDISQVLEGEFRPGHVEGMLTIVLKLLNLVRPAKAYFGEKDYQQYLLVKKMAEALLMPVDIIPCQTKRAENGLALSSRNSRLTPEQQTLAANIPRLMREYSSVEEVREELEQLGLKVEYVADKWQRRLVAVWLDSVRLLDNIPLAVVGETSPF